MLAMLLCAFGKVHSAEVPPGTETEPHYLLQGEGRSLDAAIIIANANSSHFPVKVETVSGMGTNVIYQLVGGDAYGISAKEEITLGKTVRDNVLALNTSASINSVCPEQAGQFARVSKKGSELFLKIIEEKTKEPEFELEKFEENTVTRNDPDLEQNRQRWENNLNKATTGRVVSYVDTDGSKKTIPVDTKVEYQLTQCQAYWAELYPRAYQAWSDPQSPTYDSRRAFNKQTISDGSDRRKMRRCFEGPSVGRVVAGVATVGVVAAGTYVAVDALTHDDNGDGDGGTIGPIPGDKD